TLDDFEIVVVDDTSSDNTADVGGSFADHRIRYIRHEANTGVAAARNTGIVNSRGKYIAFLDDDDEWLPEKLDLQTRCLERSPSSVGAVYTSSTAVEWSTSKVIFELTATLRGRIFETLFVNGSLAPTSTIFCRKECFDKVGLFQTDFEYGEDSDMWLRIAKEFEFECVNKPLVKFAVPHDKSSLSANYALMIRGLEVRLAQYSEIFAGQRRCHSRCYLRLGVLRYYNGNH